jgi:hypothetical protein
VVVNLVGLMPVLAVLLEKAGFVFSSFFSEPRKDLCFAETSCVDS